MRAEADFPFASAIHRAVRREPRRRTYFRETLLYLRLMSRFDDARAASLTSNGTELGDAAEGEEAKRGAKRWSRAVRRKDTSRS